MRGFRPFQLSLAFPSLLSASFAAVVMPREAAIKGKEGTGKRRGRKARGTSEHGGTEITMQQPFSIMFLLYVSPANLLEEGFVC